MKKIIQLIYFCTLLTATQYYNCAANPQYDSHHPNIVTPKPLISSHNILKLPSWLEKPTVTVHDSSLKKIDTRDQDLSSTTYPASLPHINPTNIHETLQLPPHSETTMLDCYPPVDTIESTADKLPPQPSLSEILKKYDPQNTLWHPDGIIYTNEHFLSTAREMLAQLTVNKQESTALEIPTQLPLKKQRPTTKAFAPIPLPKKLHEYFEKLEILEKNERPKHMASGTTPCCHSPFNPHCTLHIRGTHVSNPEHQIWTLKMIYCMATSINLFNLPKPEVEKMLANKLAKIIQIRYLLKTVINVYEGKKFTNI